MEVFFMTFYYQQILVQNMQSKVCLRQLQERLSLLSVFSRHIQKCWNKMYRFFFQQD